MRGGLGQVVFWIRTVPSSMYDSGALIGLGWLRLRSKGFLGLGFRARALALPAFGVGVYGLGKLLGIPHNHRLQSSSFLGLPYRIPNINHKRELLWSLWA